MGLTSSFIWGSAYFITKDSLKYISPITLVFYRFLIAFLIIAVYKKFKIFKDFKFGLITGLAMWLFYIIAAIAMRFTTASSASFLSISYIFIVPLITWLIDKEKPVMRQFLSLFFAAAGLWIFTGGISSIQLGDILMIASSFFYGVMIIYNSKFLKENIDSIKLIAQQFLVVMLFSGLLAVITGQEFTVPQDRSLFSVSYLGIFASLLALGLNLNAQKKISPNVAVLFSVFIPIVGAAISCTVGKEIFTIEKFLGGPILIFAVIVNKMKMDKIAECLKKLV